MELQDEAEALKARRETIAEAAIRVADRDGLGGLSHRAVDLEAGLPAGTTSYYARTRRQLVQLVVRLLSDRTATDVGRAPAAPPTSVEEAVARLVAAVEAIAARPADARVRLALSIELADDPELHSTITYRAPIRQRLVAGATEVLAAAGVADARSHAPDLVALLNGLVYDRLAGAGVDEEHRARVDVIVRAYVQGLLGR